MFVRTSPYIAAVVACSVAWPALAQYNIRTVAGGVLAPTSIQATQASIGAANGCAIDSAGNVYFSSASEGTVFRIDTSGVLTRVASAAPTGLRLPPGVTPAGPPLKLNSPQGLVFDKTGDLYIAESGANQVVKLSADGKLTIIAGNGTAGYAGDGGLATNAQLNHPIGLAMDSAGNLYIADRGNYRIRMVSAGGMITTFAGDGQTGPNYGGLGDGGQAINAEISFAESVAVDSHGNVYIADRMNSRVRMVGTNGVITTVAGNGSFGFSGDTASELNQPSAVAVDSSGNLYIADSGNNRIRMVAPGGTISTVAGTGTQGYSGDGGEATSAQIAVWGLTADLTGNLYLYGGDSHIRKISSGTINTIEGGVAPAGSVAASSTQLLYPEGLATDANGNVYFAEAGNHVVRKLGTDGTLTVVAGNGMPGYSGDGGSATGAQLNSPAGVAIDSKGNLYISDSGNNVIRKVTPDQNIGTFVGGGGSVCPDSGAATDAQLLNPAGLAVDSQGDLFITDSGHGCVLETTTAAQVSTIAGADAPVSDVFLSDQSTANATTLYFPQGVAVDSSGNVYIADTGNACIREVKPDGTIAVVAGNGVFGYSGDGGAATTAQLSAAWSVAVDASDNLYITDTVNERVRRVAADGTITTLAGNGAAGYSGDGGDGTCAELNTPWSVAVDSNGHIYISDWGNGAIRRLTGTAEAVAAATLLAHAERSACRALLACSIR
jgi:sugar lactone lactonase YvrE